MAQVNQLLDAAQQPVLEDFLMINLSFLRDCLTTRRAFSSPPQASHSLRRLFKLAARKLATCQSNRVLLLRDAGTQPFHECAKPSSQVIQPKVIRLAISQPKVICPAISQLKVIQAGLIPQLYCHGTEEECNSYGDPGCLLQLGGGPR
jgi:hypothetical protein